MTNLGNLKKIAAPRVLLVEDEMLLAMLMEDAMLEAGYEVRKAARVSKGLELVAAEHFDAAVLDINLGGERVFPVAAALRERGVPFLFSSGYGENGVPPDYQDRPVLQKPFGLDAFQRAVCALLVERPGSDV